MPLAAVLLPTGLVGILSTATGVALPIFAYYKTAMLVGSQYETDLGQGAAYGSALNVGSNYDSEVF